MLIISIILVARSQRRTCRWRKRAEETARNNAILLVDDDGYTVSSILGPNRLELCYMHQSQATRLASCAEMTKQP